jgi:hypothetical protein
LINKKRLSKNQLREDEKVVQFIISRHYFYLYVLDLANAFFATLTIILQVQIANGQITYRTEKEIFGMREIPYRRVFYVDATEAQQLYRMVLSALSGASFLVVMLRYWRLLTVMKATHQIPENSFGLYTSGLLGYLLLELCLSMLHSFQGLSYKVLTYENPVTFNDKFGREQIRLEKVEYTLDGLMTFACFFKVYFILRVLLHFSHDRAVLGITAEKMDFRINDWFLMKTVLIKSPWKIVLTLMAIFVPTFAMMIRLAELPY